VLPQRRRKFSTLLIANRGEIAIRVARTAAELGLPTLAIYSEDDVQALHTRHADAAAALRGGGVSAYLDGEQILGVAREHGCDGIHPGYGFLSENAEFARRCAELGIAFIGPRPEVLAQFGDKVCARALAEKADVPMMPGTRGNAATLEIAREFLESLGGTGAMLISRRRRRPRYARGQSAG
jgi:acetyl/propionyl-CoA carboxylase alpha subunit